MKIDDGVLEVKIANDKIVPFHKNTFLKSIDIA